MTPTERIKTEAAILGYFVKDRGAYLRASRAGVLPLLQRDLSAFRAPGPASHPPAIDAVRHRTSVAFRVGAWVRYWGGSDALMRRALRAARVELEDAGVTPHQSAIPLPELRREDVGTERFDTALQRPVPVVVRGWLRDSAAVRGWSVDGLLDRYTDSEVMLSAPGRGDYLGPLSDLRRDGVYMHNGEALLKRHPELVADLGLDRLGEESPGAFTYYTAQLFAGLGGTGTPYHCANQVNFFVMVSGRKRWTFVDPQFTLFMHPAIKSNPAYMGSHVGWASAPSPDAPLYPFVPRYTVDLEPGDVLFNPPWWWHCVENLTDGSIGASTRWSSNFAETNALFTLFQQTSPRLTRVQYRLMREKYVRGESIGPWRGRMTDFEASAHDDHDESIMHPASRPAHQARPAGEGAG